MSVEKATVGAERIFLPAATEDAPANAEKALESLTLVWQSGSEPSIDPCSGERAGERCDHDSDSIANECDERPGACARESPTDSKDRAAEQIADPAAHGFWWDGNFLSG